MSLQSSLYSYLSGVAALTALVSTRIYPSQAPQGAALPFVVHNTISESRFPNVAGSSGMVRTRIQFDVYAITLDAALSAADVLRKNLDGWRYATMGADFVLSVNLDQVRTDLTPPSDGGDPGTHRVTADYIIVSGESLPTV